MNLSACTVTCYEKEIILKTWIWLPPSGTHSLKNIPAAPFSNNSSVRRAQHWNTNSNESCFQYLSIRHWGVSLHEVHLSLDILWLVAHAGSFATGPFSYYPFNWNLFCIYTGPVINMSSWTVTSMRQVYGFRRFYENVVTLNLSELLAPLSSLDLVAKN